jgi:hypothetical protein
MQLPVLAIDPGTTESAFIIWDGARPLEFGFLANQDLLDKLRNWESNGPPMYIEMMETHGMAPVGQSTFQTATWIGRFLEDWSIYGYPWHLVSRTQIRTHHCHSSRAKDPNVRQALIDKYGPIGLKKTPGPLYGISKHIWSALAIASYAVEAKIECSSQISSSKPHEAKPQHSDRANRKGKPGGADAKD